MRFWANLVIYQAVWFCVVISAARGQAWMGITAALAFVLVQWAVSWQPRSDVRLLVCAVAFGVLLDGSLAASGWLRYASPTPALLAPAWILALWAAFALTLNHSMMFLRGRPVLAAMFGAVGGPLAYAGAARGFGAVAFATPAWPAMLALAVGWAIALSVLAVLAQRWHGEIQHTLSLEVAP